MHIIRKEGDKPDKLYDGAKIRMEIGGETVRMRMALPKSMRSTADELAELGEMIKSSFEKWDKRRKLRIKVK